MHSKPWIRKATGALFCASAVALVGCNSNQPPANGTPANSATASPASSAPTPAGSTAQAAAYTPPTADQLYQLVAPIALFPDNLVAQVLAGSTYPDQITAADALLAQSPSLKGAALQTAIAPQTWDPSVKGLTTFPSVLDQMAQNIQWTTSLGEAYVNDPTDVMNAIQVMRQRAAKSGNLRSSAQQNVVTQPVAAVDSSADNADNGDNGEPPVYSGPSVVPEPDQSIQIEPAQSDTVYVPNYNPQTVYGEETPDYPGYTYVQPAGYSTGDLVAVGAVTFGAAVLVGTLLEHHDHYNNQPAWGWNNWGMRWHGNRDNGGGGQWQRPTVVYNNSNYVSRSTTVVNRYTANNYNNSRTFNNSNNNVSNEALRNRNLNNVDNRAVTNAPQARAMMNRPATPAAAAKVMSVPHFGTPVRGAEPVRYDHAIATPATPKPTNVPHFGAPVHGAEPVRNEHAVAAPVHPAPTQATPHPNPSSRTAMQPHSVSTLQPHARDQVRTSPQTNPSMLHRPAAPAPVQHMNTARPVQPVVTTRQPETHVVTRAPPERAAPTPRPAPHAQTAPRPEFARPPQPAARPEPAPRPEPVRAPPRPQAAPVPHENARPAPVQRTPAKPAKKDDKDNNGH